MGAKLSGIYRRVWDWGDDDSEGNAYGEGGTRNLIKCRDSIFILKRVSSMFFNEEGDLAHEFYEEVKSRKRNISKMKRVDESTLTPQGEVDLRLPNIHPDIPVIMCEV